MKKNSTIVLAFLGVDGSGKSTIIKLLKKKLKNKFKKIKYLHLRPYLVLLDKSTTQPNPHKTKVILPLWFNFIRIVYWLIIYRIFFYIFEKKKNQLIIFDRYVHDLAIDPIRYNFKFPKKISKYILGLFPKPTLWIILNAPIKLIEKRKKELTFKELQRQTKSYLNFASQRKNSIVVDTSKSVKSSINLVTKKINSFR